MWCIVCSSLNEIISLSFPWWQIRPRSWNVIPKLFGFVLVQKTLSWWLCVCMCNRQCSVKHPTVTPSSAVFWLQDGVSQGDLCFLVSSSHWRITAWVVAMTVPWAVFSSATPTQQWPCTRAILASHPRLCCGSTQQVVVSAYHPYNFQLQADYLWWISFAATGIFWVWFCPGWVNHRFHVLVQFTPCCFPGQVHLLGLALGITLPWASMALIFAHRGRDCSVCKYCSFIITVSQPSSDFVFLWSYCDLSSVAWKQ